MQLSDEACTPGALGLQRVRESLSCSPPCRRHVAVRRSRSQSAHRGCPNTCDVDPRVSRPPPVSTGACTLSPLLGLGLG